MHSHVNDPNNSSKNSLKSRHEFRKHGDTFEPRYRNRDFE